MRDFLARLLRVIHFLHVSVHLSRGGEGIGLSPFRPAAVSTSRLSNVREKHDTSKETSLRISIRHDELPLCPSSLYRPYL
jgi:hypothetical protein